MLYNRVLVVDSDFREVHRSTVLLYTSNCSFSYEWENVNSSHTAKIRYDVDNNR
jgi:hypothetical protein